MAEQQSDKEGIVKRWSVVYDGHSGPMLESPTGRIFQIKEFGISRRDVWATPIDDVTLLAVFAEHMNRLQPTAPLPECGTSSHADLARRLRAWAYNESCKTFGGNKPFKELLEQAADIVERASVSTSGALTKLVAGKDVPPDTTATKP